MRKFKDKPTGILSAAELKTLKGRLIYFIFFAFLVVTVLTTLIPALWTIVTAFKDTQEIFEGFSFFPKRISWNIIIERISESWKVLQLGESFINTVILSIGSLAVHLLVCGLGGYSLSKLKPRGSKIIFSLIVWTMMMPSQVRMVPNYISWLNFPFENQNIGVGVNLLDTFWPMWLNAGANTFAVLLFKNAFDGLSSSYVDAAKIDGCNDFGIFAKIMLPLVMPIVIFQSINVLSASWSEFFIPLLVLSQKSVLPLTVYRMKADLTIEMNTQFMGLVFASLPPFIIFFIFQKRIIGGINIGGVKG